MRWQFWAPVSECKPLRRGRGDHASPGRAKWCIGILSTDGPELLLQRGDYRVGTTLVALNDGDEFVAQGQLHADLGDTDVGDPVLAALAGQLPLDLQRRAVRGTELAGDARSIAFDPGIRDAERRRAILAEPLAVGCRQPFLEQAKIFPLLVRREIVPISAECEAADARHIEIILQQFAKALGPLRLRHVRTDKPDALVDEIEDEVGGVFGGCAEWCR